MDFFDLRSDTFYYFVRDSVTLCVLHCVYVTLWEALGALVALN